MRFPPVFAKKRFSYLLPDLGPARRFFLFEAEEKVFPQYSHNDIVVQRLAHMTVHAGVKPAINVFEESVVGHGDNGDLTRTRRFRRVYYDLKHIARRSCPNRAELRPYGRKSQHKPSDSARFGRP
jgi:hypothetical protein